MSDEKTIYDLKLDIEGIKKDLENVNSINNRLDTAIEKLADVSSSIKSMLAVHEEKITQQEKTDEIIFEKIKDRADEIDSVYRELQREINQVERRLLIEIKALRNDIGTRVSMLEKLRWILLGAAIVIVVLVSKDLNKLLSIFS
jgi:predicted  nucleic acid-binding Zn-ribbon protein